jgi:hypothetical protein
MLPTPQFVGNAVCPANDPQPSPLSTIADVCPNHYRCAEDEKLAARLMNFEV